jgi:hypothetical protein
VRNLRKSYFVKDVVEIVSTCGKLPARSERGIAREHSKKCGRRSRNEIA